VAEQGKYEMGDDCRKKTAERQTGHRFCVATAEELARLADANLRRQESQRN